MRSGVVVAALALAGCFTARASVGPHVASSGKGGVTALAGYGFGYSFAGHQAVYLAATGGVSGDGVAHVMLADSVDYVNYESPWPVRLSGRFGVMFGRDRYALADRPFFGLGLAFFPWHNRAGGESSYQSEKGGIEDFVPDMAANRGLGVELAIDAMPGTGATDMLPAQRSAMMITCALVAEFDGMLDK
jgi:hypothetical protein